MDLSKSKPSSLVEDHTGYTPLQRGLDTVFTALNPVYAYSKVRDSLVANGMLAPRKIIKLGLPPVGDK